ncbi:MULTISPECIES: class I SAM-dependent methyltransferase [unclassified Beijerinckia]|uniref:class I SAM-dependent methyltransferase n=1 Tax=unclassified Beijerinckia TaxID=2638183 RepID=UPI0008998A19|nr:MULTISPECIES: class I SAM-dependent methyltransferase [unclassified Beijerinckia]MDH7794167.1 2-polyprenyl-3-methyl-5-hydroxy-6-metoxy-1,4-benzoquinol methylase [Beijerinckia sp. GAS462]SEB54812.1 Methyltransferase domain-containing protein [Beijerinckia sp. 28-YEA-48]
MSASPADINAISPDEWERIEREEHDRVYDGMMPFGQRSRRIDPAHVLKWEDYCFKPGARPDRGHRTRRVFELMDVDNLKGEKVLDVGSGIGQYGVFFALKGADVRGFDLSPVGVEAGNALARENGVADTCRFEVANATAMPYADEEFDIILFHEVLHHAIKYPGVREETLRVLKPGGQVIISETLRGNAVLDMMRKVSMRGEEAKGDVILEPADIADFSKGFRSYRLEQMSLLFMGKRIVQAHTGNPVVRAGLRALKGADDVLLGAFPSLRRYCGECVAVMEK